jgi:protein tyrosine phosphatase (PTP) superfamily phosphohydrolase (DUF442 family)/cytochrome c556
MRLVLAVVLALAGSHPAWACQDTGGGEPEGQRATGTAIQARTGLPVVPPPLDLETSACEAAGSLVTLDEVAPTELPGLHHVYVLSEKIISGAEPDGERALAEIAAMGVKTILSVDGKAPDVETARKYGLRYVHVPIQYKGITTDELLAISKTFREAEGPFYVHCFHGKHRGPAAAAVGRLVLDGVSREQAIAEMHQWAGTSSKYEGLYRTIATGSIPPAEQTAALDLELPEQAPLEGVAAFMVQVSRPFDALKAMAAEDWSPPADHPDLDPVNEAAILAGLMERSASMDELVDRPEDFRNWMAEARPRTAALHEALQALRAASTPATMERARSAFDAVSANCNACHRAHRDN